MRKWVSPKAVEENFTSNQNVANSISVALVYIV